MPKICFKITLLSELVLPKNSNTQGKNEHLNFINGSVLLGLVAEHYAEFSEPFELFHSGKLCFNAARVLINGKMSYKTPLCFYAPKENVDFSELYNALFCDFSSPALQEKQLKQLPQGYINDDLCYLNPKNNYALRVNLQTKDKELFGFESLQKHLEFGFELFYDEGVAQEDLQKIVQILKGRHFIGKAKSAEFGEIFIERMQDFDEKFGENLQNFKEYDFIYALSPLVLFDKSTAMPSFELNANTLGLENARVDLGKSHIKTRLFRAYNAKRGGFDSTRLIIEAGSVIAVSALSDTEKERLRCGVGGFLSEGYGRVLVNPRFLFSGADKKPFKFSIFKANSLEFSHKQPLQNSQRREFLLEIQQKGENSRENENSQNKQNENSRKSPQNENLILALRALKYSQSKQQSDFERVTSFIKRHRGHFEKISKAQWGTIRAIAYFEPQKYAEKLLEYISQERLSEVFAECKGLLNDFVSQNSSEALQLLAQLMPKQDLKGVCDE